MVNITKETRKENYIEAIVDKYDDLWLNEKYLEKKMGYSNLPFATKKY